MYVHIYVYSNTLETFTYFFGHIYRTEKLINNNTIPTRLVRHPTGQVAYYALLSNAPSLMKMYNIMAWMVYG